MSNTEWKSGYDAGFAAGWKAAKEDKSLNYQNYPPVYYGSYNPVVGGTMSSTNPYTVVLNETKTKKKIRNLTDHTLIV